jgi:hypothetical protein
MSAESVSLNTPAAQKVGKKKSEELAYEDAITQYYKLKLRYMTSIEKIKDSIAKKYPLLSNLKKRQKILKALRCIKCKKAGGSIFTNTNNILKAECNNKDAPCTLHIEIKRETYQNIRVLEEKYSKNIDALQNRIVKIKLNLLFGYASEETTLVEFNKYRNLLNEQSKQYRGIQKKFLEIVDNKSTQAMVEEKENELLLLVDTLKQMHKEYLMKSLVLTEEEKSKHNDDFMDHYLTKIVPLNDQIVNLKYKTNDLYLDEEKGQFIMEREEYGIKELEMVDETKIGSVLTFIK